MLKLGNLDEEGHPPLLTVEILGVPFSTMTEQEVLSVCTDYMQGVEPRFVITAGPELIMRVKGDPELQDALAHADVVTPDGIGVVIASRWYGQPLKERVTGVDLTHKLLACAAQSGQRVYLLGASEANLRRALDNIRIAHPGLRIIGRNGYFTNDEISAVVAAIRNEAPHLLLVGMGQPAQEKFLFAQLQALGVPLSIGVGGVIDVLSGSVKRAPEFFQKAKLEWLYRLLKEPTRLKRQMALPRFAVAAWRDAKLR